VARFQYCQFSPLSHDLLSGSHSDTLIASASFSVSTAFVNRLAQARLNMAAGLSRLPANKRAWAIGLVASVLLLIGLFSYWNMPHKTTYYIAYVGRYETPYFDELQLKALKKDLAALNSQLRNAQFDIKPFTIRKADTIFSSTDSYDAIATDQKIVVVIDNTWGVNLASVAKVIKDKGIPVISLNADRQNVDYQALVAFIGNDDYIPKKVAVFSQQILRDSKTIFVAEDESSFPSTASFKSELPGIDPVLVPSSNVDDEQRNRLFATLDEKLRESASADHRTTLIVNTHSLWGNTIIDQVHTQYKNVDILGGPYITSRMINDIKMDRGNSLIVFTESSDAITNLVRLGVDDVRRNYPELSSSVNTELYVGRCLNAVAIIEHVVLASEKQKLSKEIFASAFKNMANESFAKNNNKELYSFDGQLELADHRTFEQYFNGKVSSYPRQLNSQNQTIPNVHVGFEDIDISSIDTNNRSFHADFKYRLEDATDLEVSDYFTFGNQIRLEQKELPRSADGDRLFVVSGDFRMDPNLERYPLDSQEATIELDAKFPPDNLRVSFDREKYRDISEQLQVVNADGWEKGDSNVTLDDKIIARPVAGNGASRKLESFETVNIRNVVQRKPLEPFLTVILPLLMMGLASVMLMYLRDSSISHVGHICVGIFVAIATYRISVALVIPNLGGLSIVNKLFVGTFFTIFLIFVKVIVLNSDMVTEQTESWINQHATIIGHLSLLVYCVMVGLAFVG
jgi:hypothetical protein